MTMQRLMQRRWQLLATLFCFLFGLAFILNIHPIGDGLWFWYAVALRQGQKLYADMHLPLQPLFVLLTAWAQELLGYGWLASKVLAALQVVAYCAALFLVAGRLAWQDWQKAILIAATFGMTIAAFYSRFDDYHITGYILEVFSIYLLLRITAERAVAISVVMGTFAGFSMVNRLNDGAALFAACGFVLPFFLARRRVLAVGFFCVGAAAAMLGTIALTGDSLRAWATYSIFRAAAIKGGSGSVLLAPFQLPRHMFTALHHKPELQLNLFWISLVAGLIVLTRHYGRRSDGSLLWSRAAAGGAVLLLIAYWMFHHTHSSDLLEAIASLGVLFSAGLSVWVVVRLVRVLSHKSARGWTPRELLLLVPILQVLAGAMTSGKSVLEVYAPIAVMLLVLPFSLPARVWGWPQKSGYIAALAAIAIAAFVVKTENPYNWQHFRDRALFVDRTWYQHPVYGPIYIEKDQLELMLAMCAKMNADGPPQELLSITNPYANWFCNVPPWHGYVQTWYDTTSKATIDRLDDELATAPPKWIVYQRAEDSMDAQEDYFLSGREAPHRALDRLILSRIAQGRWSLVGTQDFYGADWMVIRTRQ